LRLYRLGFHSIKGPLTDLAENETDSARKKQLSLALRNTARLARLIDSLMDFSRIEAGRMQGQFRSFLLDSYL
jgi:signal transduction histidine kinase